jgi:hypothetical protein
MRSCAKLPTTRRYEWQNFDRAGPLILEEHQVDIGGRKLVDCRAGRSGSEHIGKQKHISCRTVKSQTEHEGVIQGRSRILKTE